MGDNAEPHRKTVLVTGFGPFGNHVVNASWVAVEILGAEGLEGVDLVVEEVPVVYTTVQSLVPALWKKHKPDLVVHVGVSSVAEGIALEQQAHNDGYDKFDVKGSCPSGNSCVSGAPQCLVSKLDMKRVCEEVRCQQCGVDTTVSMDPGRYLCDFIYFTSLNIDTSKTAFIHVPPLNKPYTAQQLALGLKHAIQAMLQQL